MKPVTYEFSRPIEVARVSKTGSHEKIAADEGECRALAQRLKLPSVHGLSAHFVVQPWRGGGYKVSGEVTADLDQVSVVSLEVFRSAVTFHVERYFVAKAEDDSAAEVDVIAGGVIDLGEVAAETVGLEIDPYPRKPGEAFQPAAVPLADEPGNVTPFAVLNPLKKP